MKSISVQLAGKTYEVHKLPIKANRAWRQKFDEPIGKLLGAARAIKAISSEEFENGNEMLKVVGVTLLRHADEIVGVLLESVDLITDAVFAYSPVLLADRENIEDHGYDEEIARAFLEVMKLAYPFSSMIEGMLGLGSRLDGMSQSSPVPNGASGKTSLTT